MTTYGLTSTGFVNKPLLTIVGELEGEEKDLFGQSIDIAAQSVFGQLNGIFGERLSEVWDGLEELYTNWDPDSAAGDALDRLCAVTGTLRLAATHSTVTLTLGGTAGTVVAAGKQASVTSTGVKFETTAAATIGGGGTITVAAQAVETGPLVGLAGTITVIETPVDGWTTVTNATDATPGRNIETDAALRLRREDELHSSGKAALEAIRNTVLDVPNVSGCAVFENTGNTTNGDGLPPKSVEVVVRGGADAAIEAAIFDSVAAGIETHGTTSGTVTDSQGIAHTIKFSAAAAVDIWIAISVTYDAEDFPLDGEAQLEAVVLAYGADNQVMGKDVVAHAIAASCFAVSGVLDCVAYINTSFPAVAETTIPISVRQIAVFDSARLAITPTPGTP